MEEVFRETLKKIFAWVPPEPKSKGAVDSLPCSRVKSLKEEEEENQLGLLLEKSSFQLQEPKG